MVATHGELSRRERKKREVRDRILEAAIAQFDQRGFSATRVAEICDQADVAQKTFFNYFPSKQDLLREVARISLDQLLADIEEVRKQPVSTAERLRLFFERLADNAEQAGPMHRELLTELVHLAHETGTGSEQARKLHEAFGAIVEDGIEAGELSSAYAARTLTEMVTGAFYALMFHWANLEDYPLRAQAAAAAHFLGTAMAAPKHEETRR